MTDRPERVWGIRSQSGVQTVAQGFALIAGLSYVAIGVIGYFFTGFDNFTENTGEELFGIFAINPFHNFVHIGVGAVWLLAALMLSRPATEGVNFAIGGFYLVAAVLGFLGYFTTLLAIDNPLDPVNFLHLVTAVVAVLFSGLIGSSAGSDNRETVGSR